MDERIIVWMLQSTEPVAGLGEGVKLLFLAN
jgi:hypothetical protein